MHDQNHASFHGLVSRPLGYGVFWRGYRIFRNSVSRGSGGGKLEIQDRWFWGINGLTTCSFPFKKRKFDRESGVFGKKCPKGHFLPTRVEILKWGISHFRDFLYMAGIYLHFGGSSAKEGPKRALFGGFLKKDLRRGSDAGVFTLWPKVGLSLQKAYPV